MATTSIQIFLFYLQWLPPPFSWLEKWGSSFSLPLQFIQYDIIRSIYSMNNKQLPNGVFVVIVFLFFNLQVQILRFDHHHYLGARQLNLYFPVPKTKPLLHNDHQAGSWLILQLPMPGMPSLLPSTNLNAFKSQLLPGLNSQLSYLVVRDHMLLSFT